MKNKKPIITILGEFDETTPFHEFMSFMQKKNPPVIIENKKRLTDYVGKRWVRDWDFKGTNHGDWMLE